MATATVTSIVRDILTSDLDLATDQVVAKARSRGADSTPEKIRFIVYKIKKELKRKGAAAPAQASAARQTPKVAPQPAPRVAPVPAPVATAAPAPVETPVSGVQDLSAVLANVVLVNRVVAQAGGAEKVRPVVDAIKACGGIDAFLQLVDLVASLRSDAAA